MKLKNKKTGEIVERSSIVTLKYKISSCSSSLVEAEEYSSIRQLNEDWEDYKPTMPLIKDPKIRKAVRAWAEANVTRKSDGIKKVFYDADEWELKFSKFGIARIQFNRPLEIGIEDKEYAIADLCGEEEE